MRINKKILGFPWYVLWYVYIKYLIIIDVHWYVNYKIKRKEKKQMLNIMVHNNVKLNKCNDMCLFHSIGAI